MPSKKVIQTRSNGDWKSPPIDFIELSTHCSRLSIAHTFARSEKDKRLAYNNNRILSMANLCCAARPVWNILTVNVVQIMLVSVCVWFRVAASNATFACLSVASRVFLFELTFDGASFSIRRNQMPFGLRSLPNSPCSSSSLEKCLSFLQVFLSIPIAIELFQLPLNFGEKSFREINQIKIQ